MQATDKFIFKHVFQEEDLSRELAIMSYCRRFSTAIDIALCTDWVSRHSDNINRVFETTYGQPITICPPIVDTITHMLVDVLAPNSPPCATQNVVRLALARATEAINYQIDWINSRVQTEPKLNHQETYLPSHLSNYCEFLFDQGMRVDDTMLKLQVDLSESREILPSRCIFTLSDITIYLLGRFIVAKFLDKHYLLPLYILSLIVGKSIELGACILSLSQVRRSDISQFASNIFHFLNWMQMVLREYGNNGHTLLKSLDGLGHGILTEDIDESHSPYLLENIIHDLVSSGFHKSRINQGITLLRRFHPFDIPNITGLAKIYGHPTIETEKGLKKLFIRTHKDIPISDEAVLRVINMAKLLFLDRFWRKHKTYPTVTIRDTVPRHLVRAILSGKSFTSPDFIEQYGKVIPGDFQGITLCECVPFDWFDRFYPLLKDKATAPRRSLIMQSMEAEDRFFPGSRRVLLTYLRTGFISREWKNFRKKFSINPRLVKDDFVIKLTSKEKEQKPEGRMFGQSPILERQRRIVGESNIALLMELYNTDQAMLINEHDKRKRMAFMSRASVYAKNSFTVIIGVDAEAWNNYFRAKLVNEFGREIFDRIFGINFYEYTMDVFNQGFIYHRDAADNIIYWEGQEGGIEGLAQKIWTWIYTVIARLVLHVTEVDGYMMVNGDDMRIILLIPKERVQNSEEVLRTYQLELLEKLRFAFRTYGIVMKIDETNMTRSLLCFGRNYVLSGMALPGDIKKIIKAGGLTDVGFPSITDVIASITSNAHSACGLSYQIIPHVVFAYTMILLYLHWHRFITLTPTTKSAVPHPRTEDTTMLLTTPNCLGGFDTLLLYQYIIQGESDPVPLALDWMMYLWHNQPSFRPVIRRCLSTPIEPIIPRGLLVVDVYALPLRRPSRPNAVVRSQIHKRLVKITRNVELLKLLQFDKAERHRIINSLWSMEPFNPRIASYLYSLSPCALVDSIVQKFDSAQTLATIIFRDDRKRNFKFFTLIIKADRKLIGSTVRRIVQGEELRTNSLTFLIPYIEQRICATAQAIILRHKVWRRDKIIDSTIPSVLQQMVICDEMRIDPSLQTFTSSSPHIDHFTARTGCLQTTPTLYGPLSRLLSAPYFSHVTGLRLGSRLNELKGNEPLISMIRKLTDAQALLSDQGGSIQEWASWSSICLFGEDIQSVCPSLVKKLGGTVGHRLPSWGFERTVYLNTLPSRTGRCRVNLDTLGCKEGLFSKNRTHNYSAMTCWLHYHCTVDVENDLLSNGYESIKWGVLVACRDINNDTSLCMCHSEVISTEYDMCTPPAGLPERLLRLINSCELTKMSEESLDVLTKYRARFATLWFGAYDYDDWLSREPSEEKYQIASQTAALIICSELEPAVVYYAEASRNDTSGDTMMFNNALGRGSALSGFSLKDYMCIDMDHLAQALVQQSVGIMIESPTPAAHYSMRNWARLLLPPGTFMGLCQSLYVARCHGRFLLALNSFLESLSTTGIPITYDLLISPSIMARAISRVISHVAHNFLVCTLPMPATYLIYLPGLETELTIRNTILTHLWRILLIAQIKSRSSHNYPPPAKHSVLSNFDSRMRVPYMAVCALMTNAFRQFGDLLCPSYVRHISLSPHQWCESLPNTIMVWDPEVKVVESSSLTDRDRSMILTLARKIINVSFLNRTTFNVVITRLPFKVCIEACHEWHEVTLHATESKRERVPDAVCIIPPQDAHTFSALPLDSDITLNDISIPDLQFSPIDPGERYYWNPACMNRYYQLSTSALNKYLECLMTIKNLNQLIKQELVILATADGSGGVSVLLTRLFVNSIVYFNTLVTDPKDRVGLADCPDSGMLRVEEASRLRCHHNASGSNDLTQRSTIERFKSFVQTEKRKFWLITCDAEAPNLESSVTDKHLSENMIRLIHSCLVDGGLVILKRFVSVAKHQLVLFLYLVSTFSHIKIMKPASSHKSSGEIFFIGYNKIRNWSDIDIERFIQTPTATYEAVERYVHIITELCSLRELPLPSTKLNDYRGIDIPEMYQTVLYEWRITLHKVLSNCQDIPRRWFSATGEVQVDAADVVLKINQLQELYPEKIDLLPKPSKRSAFLSIGAAVVILSFIHNEDFSALEARRRSLENMILSKPSTTPFEVVNMLCRFIRVGGRLMLSYLSAQNKGILSSLTPEPYV